MSCSIEKKTICARTYFVLKNELLSVTVFPSDGGRIISIYDNDSGLEFIWQNVRTKGLLRTYGADFDDLGAGGIEIAFPTCMPCTHQGIELPFFGEVWAIGWDVEEVREERSEVSVTMSCYCSITPAKLFRKVTLHAGSAEVKDEITVVNIGFEEISAFLGVHPSLAMHGDTQLIVPQNNYELVSLYPDTLKTSVLDWPMLDGVDITRNTNVSPPVYVNAIARTIVSGELSLVYRDYSKAFRITYDANIFRSLSLWMIYGGWRGHTCIMAELFRAYPYTLSEILPDQRIVIPAGKEFRTEIKYGSKTLDSDSHTERSEGS